MMPTSLYLGTNYILAYKISKKKSLTTALYRTWICQIQLKLNDQQFWIQYLDEVM